MSKAFVPTSSIDGTIAIPSLQLCSESFKFAVALVKSPPSIASFIGTKAIFGMQVFKGALPIRFDGLLERLRGVRDAVKLSGLPSVPGSDHGASFDLDFCGG